MRSADQTGLIFHLIKCGALLPCTYGNQHLHLHNKKIKISSSIQQPQLKIRPGMIYFESTGSDAFVKRYQKTQFRICHVQDVLHFVNFSVSVICCWGGGIQVTLYCPISIIFSLSLFSCLSLKLNVFIPSSHGAPLISAQRKNKKQNT